MSNVVESLQKILDKSSGNGFEFRTGSEITNIEYLGFGRFDVGIIPSDSDTEISFIFHWNELFFNHNFAKCFFGEDSYKQQLQIMVLEENPLEYLLKLI